MRKHSHSAVLSVFAGTVTEHVSVLRDIPARLARPDASDDDLHQFRVTLRRLRSAKVTFEPIPPVALTAEWKPRLRSSAASTGAVREWDVPLLDWIPAVQQCLDERDEAAHQWLEVAIGRVKCARATALRKKLLCRGGRPGTGVSAPPASRAYRGEAMALSI